MAEKKQAYTRVSEVVATPNVFHNVTSFEREFGDEKIRFLSNDLDAYLYQRSRLTDVQLAALSAQLSSSSSVFDSLSDEQQIQFLNSRYNQNFASVDSYRQYLVSNLGKLDADVQQFVKDSQTVEKADNSSEAVETVKS